LYYGNWKAETPNEKVIENLMKDLDLYPFNNESEMINKTKIDEDLYHKILKKYE